MGACSRILETIRGEQRHYRRRTGNQDRNAETRSPVPATGTTSVGVLRRPSTTNIVVVELDASDAVLAREHPDAEEEHQDG